MTGGGRGMTQVDGKCTGPLYRKQPRPVADFCAAAAKMVVRDSANVDNFTVDLCSDCHIHNVR